MATCPSQRVQQRRARPGIHAEPARRSAPATRGPAQRPGCTGQASSPASRAETPAPPASTASSPRRWTTSRRRGAPPRRSRPCWCRPHPDWIGTATGVDEDGTIVGSVQSSLSRLRTGYEWLTDGTGRTLPVPAVNGKPVKEYFASAIRDGWVSGGSADPGRESPVQASVLWNLGTGEISVTAEVSTSRSTPEAGSRAARSPTPRRTTSQHDQRRRHGPRRCSMRGRLGRRRGEIGGMAVGKDDRRQYGAHTL